MAVDEMNHLPISEKRHGWAAGLILSEVLARASRSLEVLPGKNCHNLLRHNRMLERECKGWTSITRRAAANGIHKDQHRPSLIPKGRIDLCCAGELARTHSGHLGAHRSH